MSSRRPPLHTCGLSFMEIADEVCIKAQQLSGPIGSMTKKISRMASLASPFVYALEYQLLLIFSFLDDRIFALEYVVEAIFPPSKYVFDKVDEFVKIAEVLPGKFDEAVSKFPTIIHQVPFLDWALFRAISSLNFFLSILIEWGSENAKEKEILIDINCNESSNESGAAQKADQRKESQKNGIKEDGVPTSVSSGVENGTVMKCTYKDALEKVMKATYKDALEKGTKELDSRNEEKKEGRTKKSIGKKKNRATAETEIKEAITEGKMKKNIEKKEETVKKEIRKSRPDKEATKGGTKKKIENTEKSAKEETEKSIIKEVNREGGDKNANKIEEKLSNGDQILELFESAWLASPRNKETPSSLSRSVSYQW